METYTVIEYRDLNNKLREAWYDETLYFIKRSIREMYERGASDFVVVRNDKNYDFYWLNDYQ